MVNTLIELTLSLDGGRVLIPAWAIVAVEQAAGYSYVSTAGRTHPVKESAADIIATAFPSHEIVKPGATSATAAKVLANLRDEIADIRAQLDTLGQAADLVEENARG